MRFLLCTLLALLLPISAESQVQREIHFQYRGGLIWLKVNVSGKSEPLNFLLDSGAGFSAIDLQTARSLRAHLGNRQIVQGVNGQCFAYRVNDLQAVWGGGVALPKSVLAVDLRALSASCQQPVDGIVGLDFFPLGISVRHMNTSLQLGKQCFKAVTTGVHREPIFPGEAGLLGNGLL